MHIDIYNMQEKYACRIKLRKSSMIGFQRTIQQTPPSAAFSALLSNVNSLMVSSLLTLNGFFGVYLQTRFARVNKIYAHN